MERALRLMAFWPSAKVEGCVFGLRGLIGPRKGLAPHRPLLLKLGAGGRSQAEYTAGRPQESKVPREEVDSCIPSIPSGSLSGEQQAAMFNPQEKLSMEQRTAVQVASRNEGRGLCQHAGGCGSHLVLQMHWEYHPGAGGLGRPSSPPGPLLLLDLDLLHPAPRLPQNEMR